MLQEVENSISERNIVNTTTLPIGKIWLFLGKILSFIWKEFPQQRKDIIMTAKGFIVGVIKLISSVIEGEYNWMIYKYMFQISRIDLKSKFRLLAKCPCECVKRANVSSSFNGFRVRYGF